MRPIRMAFALPLAEEWSKSTMPDPKKGLAAGELAPDFTLMPALGETPVHFAEYRGQWVVLLFFRGLI
jgi:hypothetical protein